MTSKDIGILFDFDGTLADSFSIFVHSIEIVSKRSEKFTNDELNIFRSNTVTQNLKILKVKKWQIPSLLIKGKKEMNKQMVQVKPFDGISEILSELSKEYKLYILSTNSKENIDIFLKKYNMTNYFSAIYPDVAIWGKTITIRRLCKREKLSITKSVYVGDEIRDIEAAKRARIKSIAVGWGFSNPDTLLKYRPNKVALKLNDLNNTINELTASNELH